MAISFNNCAGHMNMGDEVTAYFDGHGVLLELRVRCRLIAVE
jgi:hypothetical protein